MLLHVCKDNRISPHGFDPAIFTNTEEYLLSAFPTFMSKGCFADMLQDQVLYFTVAEKEKAFSANKVTQC